MWKFVFISLALIHVVQCRTNQEVMDEFEPVIRERHEAFTALQNLTTSTMKPRFEVLEMEIFRLANNFGYRLSITLDGLPRKIANYIHELGLDDSEEARECEYDMYKRKDKIGRIMDGELRACSYVPTAQNAKIYLKNYTDLLHKLENEHVILNVTTQECLTLSSPFEVQTCLIDNLYTFYIPYLKDVTDYTNSLIEDWTNELDEILNDYVEPCFEFTEKDFDNKIEVLVKNTKNCINAYIPKTTVRP